MNNNNEDILYVVECGYNTETGSYFSPIFITKNPNLTDQLNELKPKWTEKFYSLRKECAETNDYMSFGKLMQISTNEVFGDYAYFITDFSEDHEFVFSELPIVD